MMSPDRQKTIAKEASFSGRGLFSGEPTTVTIAPAEANQGIHFIREQDGKIASIAASIHNLKKSPRRTCLKNGTLLVETVEHCLAALAGLGVDNALVRVSGGKSGELPAGDGSSNPFVELLQKGGLRELDAMVDPFVIRRPEQVSIGEATLAALPGPTDKLEIIYDFEAAAPLGRQVFCFTISGDKREEFISQVAPARTWVFDYEARDLQSRGLGTHLTPQDLLVISPQGPVDNAFRFVDECARHKVLDLIGDLYLLGRPLRGRLVAHKSGHELNHMLVRKLIRQQEDMTRESLIHRDAALDIRRIQRILPHRYPMLLVDRVLEITSDQRAVGIKNVTFNDIFFQGHYPGTPIMPGVLIVEAMAQLGGLLLSSKLEHTGKLAVLLSMDKVKMRQPVVPGDQLVLEAVTVRVKSRTGHVRCKAFVGDKMAAEADIKFMLVDAEPV
jgi:UDP-3-O-[3-hydroxymyristoyl] N-acetylglucosamine deacetylase/3-hydroxyacyl-[acyl-carrier-protein] dehydratase